MKIYTNTKKILCILLRIFAIICFHVILVYYIGDYYNINKWDTNDTYKYVGDKEVYEEELIFKCSDSKYQEEYKILLYNDKIQHQYPISYVEGFFTEDSVGSFSLGLDWRKTEYGTIPDGKYLITEEGTRKSRYNTGRQVKKVGYTYERVPKYRRIDYGYGLRDRILDGYEYEPKQYTYYEDVYNSYNWAFAISTYDISDQFSWYSNNDTIRKNYISNIEKQLKANFDVLYVRNNDFMLSYYIYDEQPMKRMIFCRNKNAYLLEVKSIGDLDEQSSQIFEQLHFKKDNPLVLLTIKRITLFLLLFALILLLQLITTKRFQKQEIKNKVANKIYVIGAICNIITVCIIIMYFMFNFIHYADKIKDGSAILQTVYLFVCLLTLGLPCCSFINAAIDKQHTVDYIVPKWLDKIAYGRIENPVAKRAFIALVAYPIMTFHVIPFGYYALFYTLPALFISVILVWSKALLLWIKRG